MKMSTVIFTVLLICPLVFAQQISKFEWYRFEPKQKAAFPGKSFQVECVLKDSTVKVLLTTTEETQIPCELPFAGPLLETTGSKDIFIRVNKDVGYTYFAGLLFYDSAKVSIGEDGTVEVDRAGIRAKSETGSLQLTKTFKPLLDDVSLILTTNMGFEFRNKEKTKIVGDVVLIDLSGKSQAGVEWVSAKKNVNRKNVFLLIQKQ